MGLLLLAMVLAQVPGAGAGPVSDAGTSAESLPAARDRYEAVLAGDPGNAAAQAGEVEVSERMALQARGAHDENGALGYLLRAQKFAPESSRLLFDLGVLEEQIGLYHDADVTVQHLRKLSASTQAPEPKAVYLAARVELDLGRLADAERDMRAYLQARPEDATAYFGLGRILEEAQQPGAAKVAFQRSVELKPTQTESYYQLAQLALETGDFPAAIANNAEVLQRNPHHGGALTGTGIAYFRTKQYPLAEEALRKAVTEAPEYQLGHYSYGLVLARVGKKEEAARELALAAKMAEDANRKGAQRLRLNP